MALLRTSLVEAVRFFRRSPSVAIPAAAILGLGLGANVAIFAVAHAVLLRPLPIADQRSLVIMWERSEQESTSVWEVSYRDFQDWESANGSFSHLAAMGSVNWSLRLLQPDGPIVLPFAAVSGTFFDTLGAQPVLGRGLTRADDQRSGAAVAVLSHSTWRDHFGSDPAVIGRTATLDDGGGGRAFTVIGVMAREFDYPRGAAMWLPIAPTLHQLSTDAGFDMLEERHLGILYVLGRLRPGIHLSQAGADMNAIVGRLTGTGTPGTGRSIVVTPLTDHIFGQTRQALVLLLIGAGLVLFLTCANVIGLLMARLSANRRELAVRIALGAERAHLLRQTLAEAASLVVVGAAAAVLLAIWCVPLLTALAPQDVPRLSDISVRTSALAGFLIGASVLVVLVCGVFPLSILLRRAGAHVFGSHEKAVTTTTRRIRSGLLVIQIALSVVLLVAAMLTVRSFQAVQRLDLGFNPAGLITFDVLAPPGKHGKQETNGRFYRPAIERLQDLPGVVAVAGVYLRPFEFGPIGSGVAVLLEGQPPRDREAWRKNPTLNAEAVTPDYFAVMQIPLVQGRAFTDHDDQDSPGVVILSASAAGRLWPGEDPIGKRLMASYDRPKGDWQTVVGVVGDVRYRGLTLPTLDLYKPYLQSEDAAQHFIVRTSQDTSVLLPQLRSEIRSVDSQAVVDAIRPMDDVVDRQLAPWRFAALLFVLLATLALVIAIFGLYALLVHQTAERVREIGIRMALGARHQQIVALFARRTARVVAGGLGVGLAAALLTGRSMNALLFGVSSIDAWTYAAVCAVLLVAASIGAYGPIRRATTVDPVVALRQQ